MVLAFCRASVCINPSEASRGMRLGARFTGNANTPTTPCQPLQPPRPDAASAAARPSAPQVAHALKRIPVWPDPPCAAPWVSEDGPQGAATLPLGIRMVRRRIVGWQGGRGRGAGKGGGKGGTGWRGRRGGEVAGMAVGGVVVFSCPTREGCRGKLQAKSVVICNRRFRAQNGTPCHHRHTPHHHRHNSRHHRHNSSTVAPPPLLCCPPPPPPPAGVHSLRPAAQLHVLCVAAAAERRLPAGRPRHAGSGVRALEDASAHAGERRGGW